MSHHRKNKHFGPFQDHPHTPKGVTFEKPKRPVLQVRIVYKGKNVPEISLLIPSLDCMK